MSKTVLIVDDEFSNQQSLEAILKVEYEVLVAKNGEEALSEIKRSYKLLSAVLLDLNMPIMSGYEVIEQMKNEPLYAQIPIIVIADSADEAAEVKALALGANDFVEKHNKPALILHRLRNTIKLREAAASINALHRDKLTNLYDRETFFDKASEMVAKNKPGYYIISAYNINNFRHINDQYGNAKGDEVLKHIAKTLQNGFDAIGGICSRITADIFAVMYPLRYMGTKTIKQIRKESMNFSGLPSPISCCIGRYIISDKSLSITAMFDRAVIAMLSVKGQVDKQIAHYDEAMHKQIVREQEIISEMNVALQGGQFEPWFQPQYNHASGAIVGAEALVRWRHPKNGLIPPSEFIPIFERNGFIYQMDKSIWEQTCAHLRRWINEGRKPIPISVNVSRYDVLRSDFFEEITGIVSKYQVPLELLRLEITESAFSKAPAKIIAIVKKLIDYGFTVEIDDFGSGYSSLNTLKDVPANILKLDMRFLESNENSDRGGNILESIVRMAKWLGMPIIAEGVETKEQANYLRSVGCYYMQGYLYAKPMPVEDYESLVSQSEKEHEMITLETVENLDNNAFWNPKSMDTLIFNSYVGGACIFEYINGKIEIIRANEKYAKAIGGEKCTIQDVLNLSLEKHMDEAAANATKNAVERAIKTGDEVTYEASYFGFFGSQEKTYLRTTIKVIAKAQERFLLYATNENITLQHEAEQKRREAAEKMQAVMNNVKGGITAASIDDGLVHFLFSNDEYYAMQGYTKEQFEQEVTNAFDLVHPDDRERITAVVQKVIKEHGETTYDYRIRKRNGEFFHARSNVSVVSIESIGKNILLAITTDVTEFVKVEQEAKKATELSQAIMQNINGGVTAVTIVNGEPKFLFANRQFYELYGCTKEEYEKIYASPFDPIIPEDREYVVEEVRKASLLRKPFSVTYRNFRRDGSIVWIQSNMSIINLPGVSEPVQLSVANDVTAAHEGKNAVTACLRCMRRLYMHH